jgi:hypothetical protein
MSGIDRASRKARLSEAYLGHRLNRAQLQTLLKEVDAPAQQWNDKFESLAATRVESDTGPVTALEELGLLEKFQRLDDSAVWTAEERAIHRHMSKLGEPRPQRADEELFSNPDWILAARNHFNDWDRDKDFVLDRNELDFVMSGGFYGQDRKSADTPESAATLAVLRKHLDYVQSANPADGEGVSLSDLLLMEDASTDLLREMKTMIGEDFQEYIDLAHQMVEHKPLEQENIDPKVIHQGVVGSCVLLSTLAGIPKEALQKMLQPNPDGGFQVEFADGVTEHVHEPTVAERLYHAKGDNLERWPALIELAMAQRLYDQERPADKALRSAIDGIEPKEALLAIGDTETDKRSLDEMSVNQTREALREMTARVGPVICGSRPRALSDFISNEELKNGIHNSHCYSVLGFDAENDKVTLRNPWGRGEWHHQDSPDDGVFEMPTRDFYSSFRWVAGAA